MFPGTLDLFASIDQNVPLFITEYGFWTYLILFAIVVCETGLVITSFLPGDSLLFVSGLSAASGLLSLPVLIVLFWVAGITGSILNYWIGRHVGTKVLREKFPDLVRKDYLDRTERYFERFGGKTIFISRFIPLVRTFAPFLAGVSRMEYRKFLVFSILSAAIWAAVMPTIGYLFGTSPWIQQNIIWFIYGMIILTLATVVVIVVALVHGYFKRSRVIAPDQQE
jgi:membrane-associated protein